MIPAQDCKWLNSAPPVAIIDDGSLAVTEIDTLGYDYAEIIVCLGATDIALTAMAITESDVTASGHANVTGLISGTSANIAGSTSTLPSATNDNGIFLFEIDLRGRKRFLDATITVGDGTVGGFYTCVTRLSRSKISPQTAAEKGCVEVMRV